MLVEIDIMIHKSDSLDALLKMLSGKVEESDIIHIPEIKKADRVYISDLMNADH